MILTLAMSIMSVFAVETEDQFKEGKDKYVDKVYCRNFLDGNAITLGLTADKNYEVTYLKLGSGELKLGGVIQCRNVLESKNGLQVVSCLQEGQRAISITMKKEKSWGGYWTSIDVVVDFDQKLYQIGTCAEDSDWPFSNSPEEFMRAQSINELEEL